MGFFLPIYGYEKTNYIIIYATLIGIWASKQD